MADIHLTITDGEVLLLAHSDPHVRRALDEAAGVLTRTMRRRSGLFSSTLRRMDGEKARRAGVVVERVPIPEWANDLLLRRQDQADLLILPARVQDGRGEYQDADLPGVRALHAAGVRVDWAHEESERTFISEYGAGEVGAVGMFVAQTLAQENIGEIYRWLLTRIRQALRGQPHGPGPAQFTVVVDRVKIDGTRREIEGFKVTGPDERVVDVAMALVQGDPPAK